MRILIALLAFLVMPAVAEIRPIIEYGENIIMYEKDIEQETGRILKLGLQHNQMSYYLWAGDEDFAPRERGQSFGQIESLAFGGGLGYTHGPVKLFMEGGVNTIDFSANEKVLEEVATTIFMQNHDYEGRPRVPGTTWWEDGFFIPDTWGDDIGPATTNYSYDVEDTYLARIGMQWTLWKYLTVTGAYRWSVADTELNIWDSGNGIPERHGVGEQDCGCWWKETDTVNFSGFELGVGLKW